MTGHPLESSIPDQLKLIPGDCPIVVLMRHSIRGPLPEGSAGTDVRITEAGWKAARRLGEALAERVVSVHASPVRRCVETAQAIVEGTGDRLSISEDRMLGDPGAFVLDSRLAWENWQRLGNQGVMRHMAVHEAPLPGIARPEIAARMLARHLLACTNGRSGVHLFVTHDAVLSPVASRLISAPVEQCITPDFLEAAVIWLHSGEISARYRGWVVNSIELSPHLSIDEVTEFARREIGRTIGLRNDLRFFLAGGAFKSILAGSPPRDLDLWTTSQTDRVRLIEFLLERGAKRLESGRYSDRLWMAGRTIDIPLRTDSLSLEDLLARFDIALSAIGVEMCEGEPICTRIHPLVLDSIAREEILLLKPLANWKHCLSTLARMRRYARELGFHSSPEEEEEVWRVFTREDAEMRQGMIERYLPLQTPELSLKEIACRCT